DPAVVEIAQSIRARDLQPEQQILAALRMVQDDIRYFSLALAESTHRPTPPGMVLERRFGDCKDKSLLAVTLLRELGFDAHVALVRSDGGALLPHLMPSIKAFDHAIVTVHHDGRDWWFDPTMLYQRGRIEDMAAR